MLIPISKVDKNVSVTLESINLDKSLKHRLLELGIYPKMKFSVLSRYSNNLVVIVTDHFKLAVDTVIANQLFVFINR